MNKKLLLPLIVLVATSVKPEIPAGNSTEKTVTQASNSSALKLQERQLVDFVFRNNVAGIKQVLEQDKYSSKDINWAFVAATCSANTEIMQLLIDHNNTHAQKILGEDTICAARTTAHFRELIPIIAILENSKLYPDAQESVDDDLDLAIQVTAYIGHLESVKTLLPAYEKVIEELQDDADPEDSDPSDLEIFLNQLTMAYIIADAQNNSTMKEILKQAIAAKSNVSIEKLIQVVVRDTMGDISFHDDIDLENDIDDLEDPDKIIDDIDLLLVHEVIILAYKHGLHDLIKRKLSNMYLFDLTIKMGLIDAVTKTLITTSQDQDFKKFINNIIQEQFVAYQKAKERAITKRQFTPSLPTYIQTPEGDIQPCPNTINDKENL